MQLVRFMFVLCNLMTLSVSDQVSNGTTTNEPTIPTTTTIIDRTPTAEESLNQPTSVLFASAPTKQTFESRTSTSPTTTKPGFNRTTTAKRTRKSPKSTTTTLPLEPTTTESTRKAKSPASPVSEGTTTSESSKPREYLCPKINVAYSSYKRSTRFQRPFVPYPISDGRLSIDCENCCAEEGMQLHIVAYSMERQFALIFNRTEPFIQIDESWWKQRRDERISGLACICSHSKYIASPVRDWNLIKHSIKGTITLNYPCHPAQCAKCVRNIQPKRTDYHMICKRELEANSVKCDPMEYSRMSTWTNLLATIPLDMIEFSVSKNRYRMVVTKNAWNITKQLKCEISKSVKELLHYGGDTVFLDDKPVWLNILSEICTDWPDIKKVYCRYQDTHTKYLEGNVSAGWKFPPDEIKFTSWRHEVGVWFSVNDSDTIPHWHFHFHVASRTVPIYSDGGYQKCAWPDWVEEKRKVANVNGSVASCNLRATDRQHTVCNPIIRTFRIHSSQKLITTTGITELMNTSISASTMKETTAWYPDDHTRTNSRKTGKKKNTDDITFGLAIGALIICILMAVAIIGFCVLAKVKRRRRQKASVDFRRVNSQVTVTREADHGLVSTRYKPGLYSVDEEEEDEEEMEEEPPATVWGKIRHFFRNREDESRTASMDYTDEEEIEKLDVPQEGTSPFALHSVIEDYSTTGSSGMYSPAEFTPTPTYSTATPTSPSPDSAALWNSDERVDNTDMSLALDDTVIHDVK